jgi:hypothetical protein
MTRRPGIPGDQPAPNGHTRSARSARTARPDGSPAATPATATPATDDETLGALRAAPALHWAAILKRFRDYMHHS